METFIGYVEKFQRSIYNANGNVELKIEWLVQDLGLAAYELRLIDGALFVFELKGKTKDGEKELILVSNNFSIIRI